MYFFLFHCVFGFFINSLLFWSLQLKLGVDVAHPGISNDFNDEDAKKYYTYYQWVCFVLFFQVRASIFLKNIEEDFSMTFCYLRQFSYKLKKTTKLRKPKDF